MQKIMDNDIFIHLEKLDGNDNKPNISRHFKYKMKGNELRKAYAKLNILINMKLMNKALYIRAAIAKIHIAKALFILEIEYTREAYIPHELSQHYLPINFRYNDPILGFVQDYVC